MGTKTLVTRALVLAAVFALAVAAAQTDVGPKSEPREMSSAYNPLLWQDGDAQFAINTEHTSFCQARFSKEAAARLTDNNALTIARISAAEHEKLYRKLKTMARSLNFEFPRKSTMEDCPEMQKAQDLAGTDLQSAYMSYMRDTNTAAVQEFEAELTHPEKPDNYSLRKLAEKYLPTLKDLQAKLSAAEAAPKP